MTSPSLAPTHALVGSTPWLETASSSTATQATQVDQGGGWLYHLLTKLGVSPDTASTVTDLVIRPLSILVVVVIALDRGPPRCAGHSTRAAARGQPGQLPLRLAARGARVTTMSSLLANIWRFFIFVVAGAIVLGLLGINLTPLLASATIIGATLGFGAQQIVRDYFSGVLMTMEDQYNVGDSITVGGVTGVVEDVSMRLTRFRGVDGTIYIVPNGDIRLVGNLSRGWARAVVDLTLPGATAADLDTVRRVIEEAAHRVATGPTFATHCTEPPNLVGLLAADSSTVTMRVMLLTVPSQRDALTRALREEAITALAKAELWPADAAPPAAPTH